MKLALLAGTSILHSPLFDTWKAQEVATPYGAVTVKCKGGLAVLNRHGFTDPKAPHAINYRANIRALASLGFTDVLALNSVGSLQPDLPPGTLVSCADYVNLQSPPMTFAEGYVFSGASPGIANALMPELIGRLAPEFIIHPGKTYVQMRGPRFETRAEIRIIRQWGDVVGMTLAHEADLCTEAGLRVNSLAMIDNYANGLLAEEIDFDKFNALVRQNQETVNRLLGRLLGLLETRS